MKTFIVTIITRGKKRMRFAAVARNWYEAWLDAINEHGIVALISVRPVK